MRKIILISACKTKSDEKGFAKDLYKGQFTEKAYRYATKIENDAIFFLSPKFGLVEPNAEIQNANFTFDDLTSQEKKNWYRNVLNELRKKKYDLGKDHFVFLAYKRYWKGLVPAIKNYETPIEHLRIGKQLGWITEKLNEVENKK